MSFDDKVKVCKDNPLNSNNPSYVELNSVVNNSLKISNDGYKGITVKDGDKYDFSFWARNIQNGKSLTVQIEDENGNVISESKTINKINDKWTKYEGHLRANKTTSNAKFTVSLKDEGKIDLDMVDH